MFSPSYLTRAHVGPHADPLPHLRPCRFQRRVGEHSTPSSDWQVDENMRFGAWTMEVKGRGGHCAKSKKLALLYIFIAI